MIQVNKKIAAAIAAAAVVAGGAGVALPAIASATAQEPVALESATAGEILSDSSGLLHSAGGSKQSVGYTQVRAAEAVADDDGKTAEPTVIVTETEDSGVQYDERGEWSIGTAELIEVAPVPAAEAQAAQAAPETAAPAQPAAKAQFVPPAEPGMSVTNIAKVPGGYMVTYESDEEVSGTNADGSDWSIGTAELITFIPFED